MRRLLLPLLGLSLLACAGGCSQFIADKVLIPPRNATREAGLGALQPGQPQVCASFGLLSLPLDE